MKEQTSQFPDSQDPWDRGVYQTGSTTPPKSHSGLVTMLLITTIFFCGLSSALGVLNIRLFHQLASSSDRTPEPLSFSNALESQPRSAGPVPAFSGEPTLGIHGETVTAFYQNYYNLPSGLYVEEILIDTPEQQLREGDILVSLAGSPVASMKELNKLLSARQAGDILDAVVFRAGKEQTLSLTVLSCTS